MAFFTKAFVDASLNNASNAVTAFLATMPAKTPISITLSIPTNGSSNIILLYQQ